MSDAIPNTDCAKRKTVTAMDVVYALKRQSHTCGVRREARLSSARATLSMACGVRPEAPEPFCVWRWQWPVMFGIKFNAGPFNL